MSRVVIVGRKELEIKVARLYDREIRKLPLSGMALELETVVMKSGNVLELSQISVKQSGRDVLIIDPKRQPRLME